MNIELAGRLYQKDGSVYIGTRQLVLHEQRGRRYVCVGKRQTNIHNIPALPGKEADNGEDYVFNYIFKGGFETHPCPAMDYWIRCHRMKDRLTPMQYKAKYL